MYWGLVEVKKVWVSSFVFLLSLLVIVLVWKHFLSITEILILLALYITVSGIFSYYLDGKIKSIAEYTLSIIVDGYVGMRIIQSIRPHDHSSIYFWVLFIVFAYLIGIKKHIVEVDTKLGEEK